MRFCKIVSDGYIITIATGGNAGTEITEEEYNAILSALQNCPTAPAGYAYRLKADLTWELVELPPEPEPDVTPEEIAEALEVIL